MMDGTRGACSGDGNRRRFLKTAAATGAVLASADALRADEPGGSTVPKITLGKTGQQVTRLGMGSSWDVDASFVQRLLFAGLTYIDTSESYERGNAERTLGAVLDRTGKRKDVYLVTKNASYRKALEPGGAKIFAERLDGSLDRLKTDYVDCYYIHGIEGSQIPLLFDDSVKAAFEALKKSGKIRFAGLSCHDARLVEVVEAVAKCGWIDQIMIQYNYRTMTADALRRAVDKASEAKLGLVAMKTQGGAEAFDPAKFPAVSKFIDDGFNRHQAAIKTVLADDRFHVVVSEMVNRTQLQENMAAAAAPLTPREARLLEEHRRRTANLYCHGCGHLCESAANGLPVATVLRYLRYYSTYGKRSEARALYQALPAEARDLAAADLAAAERACPHGLPIVQLIGEADRNLS